MKLGLDIPRFRTAGGAATIAPRLDAVATAADKGGYDALFVMDHFFEIPAIGPFEEEMPESTSVLSYLAARTSRMRLGALVAGVTYRYPGVLVKQITGLDVLSGGRAIFGVGAAWFDREHAALGVPFPPLKERFERLEELLKIALQTWSGETGPYQGKHYQLAETFTSPMPLSKPHPTILIGGAGEQKTLRLVARYGDACNLFGAMPHEVLRHKLDVLRGHCDAEGRDYNTIEKTALLIMDFGPDGKNAPALLEQMHALHDLGFDMVIQGFPDIDTIEPIQIAAELLVPEMARF